MSDPIPAATLVVFRRGEGRPEHLFVVRAATMSFAAGAVVFPGGRVDPGDRMLAARFPDLDPDDAAARIAAIRETVEEAGVAIGLHGKSDATTVARLRDHLRDGVVFADALAALQLDLAPDMLVPFARWLPKLHMSRVFDTRFYLAELPEGAPAASVDETENVRLFWASAQQVIDDADAGGVEIIFPTRRNLERLAQFDSFAAACAQAAQIAPELVSPWIEERGGVRHLCIPEGRGYPVCSEILTAAIRG